MAGRPPRTEEVKVVFLRLPTDLLKRVTRCTGMIETREGIRLDQTKAFRHLLEIACDTVEHQQTPLAPLAVSETSKLAEIANIANGTPPAYDDMLTCLGEEEETPALPVDVPEASEMPELVTRPAPASHVNGQGAPAPQPTTQPAIPLALEPAPKTAHPVDVPQAAETPVLAEIAQLATEALTVSADMAAVLADEEEEEMPQPVPAEPVPARAHDDYTGGEESTRQTAIPPYDATKYMLGKLCPQRHEWATTGQSLLSIKSRNCKECRNASKRQKRAEKRQGQPA